MTTTKRRKVKLFYSDAHVHLADEKISKWIEDNPSFEIEDVKATGAGSEHYTNFIIMITYFA